MTCPSCNSSNTKGVERTTVTGLGSKCVTERQHCLNCHDDFKVDIAQPFVPFGEPLGQMFGDPVVVTEPIISAVGESPPQ